MDPVVHFEMGYNDRERMKKFYTSTFGWQTEQTGPEMGNYVLATTSPVDKNKMHINKGAINGGFYQKTENPDSHAPSVVIAVKDIKKAMQDVVKNGGKIKGAMGQDGKPSMEPQMIPGVGLWISIEDTEGNRVSILEPQRGK